MGSRLAYSTSLSALGGDKGRGWVLDLQKDSGLREQEAWKQGSRKGHRPGLPSKDTPPPPSTKPGTSWPGLEQEEALEVCRKTGSDCRKWVPLFGHLPRLAPSRHCPQAGSALSSLEPVGSWGPPPGQVALNLSFPRLGNSWRSGLPPTGPGS